MSDPATASQSPRLTGLLAATFTPFNSEGDLNLELVPEIVEHLIRNGISGIYICGSTGEGPSLTTAERKAVAEAYVSAAQGRLRTVIHMGHTVIQDARELAEHAEMIGANAISAISPYYFKPEDVDTLMEFLARTSSAAPSLPFYYYHIPALTGVAVDPVAFLERGQERIPNLRGIKFTDPDISKFTACQEAAGGTFDVLFGRDEMLLSGLAAGAQGAVGSTYNFAPSLYRRVMTALAKGDLDTARHWQAKAAEMIRAIISVGGEAAIKVPMARLGFPCGQRRLPMRQLSEEATAEINRRLDEMGFDDWATEPVKQGEAAA